jgi:hypothetical protein
MEYLPRSKQFYGCSSLLYCFVSFAQFWLHSLSMNAAGCFKLEDSGYLFICISSVQLSKRRSYTHVKFHLHAEPGEVSKHYYLTLTI